MTYSFRGHPKPNDFFGDVKMSFRKSKGIGKFEKLVENLIILELFETILGPFKAYQPQVTENDFVLFCFKG